MVDFGCEQEKEIRASIYLMGSFQDKEMPNDIDLIIVYENYNFEALREIKKYISTALKVQYSLPTHFTTLSMNEYLEMKELHAEKHQIIFDYNCMRYKK